MKLNIDCIREILFYLEENLSISDTLEFLSIDLQEISSALTSYSTNELVNTLIVLDEADYIKIDIFYADDHIDFLSVSRITFTGYQFIENIRSDTIWKKVKTIGTNVGSFSLNTVSQIAINAINALISTQINL